MHDPQEPHFITLKRILSYAYGIFGHGLQIFSSPTRELIGYSYADWAHCLVAQCSTSGYWVFLGDNLLSWSFKRQHTISQSSVEAY